MDTYKFLEFFNKTDQQVFPPEGEKPKKIELRYEQDEIKTMYTNMQQGDCVVCVISVEPGWIHFDDFINHGLLEIWEYAHENPNKSCSLIFQNINFVIPILGLTPLLDVLNINRIKLPYSKHNGVPKNLDIFATVSCSDYAAIPIDKFNYSDLNQDNL